MMDCMPYVMQQLLIFLFFVPMLYFFTIVSCFQSSDYLKRARELAVNNMRSSMPLPADSLDMYKCEQHRTQTTNGVR